MLAGSVIRSDHHRLMSARSQDVEMRDRGSSNSLGRIRLVLFLRLTIIEFHPLTIANRSGPPAPCRLPENHPRRRVRRWRRAGVARHWTKRELANFARPVSGRPVLPMLPISRAVSGGYLLVPYVATLLMSRPAGRCAVDVARRRFRAPHNYHHAQELQPVFRDRAGSVGPAPQAAWLSSVHL